MGNSLQDGGHPRSRMLESTPVGAAVVRMSAVAAYRLRAASAVEFGSCVLRNLW